MNIKRLWDLLGIIRFALIEKRWGDETKKKIVHELTSLDNDSQFNWENKLWQKWRTLKKNITLKNINKLYRHGSY